MIKQGATFRCQNCQSEVEVISGGHSGKVGGPLVCCEVEMKEVGDEFKQLWETEAYDELDFDWD